MERWLIIGVILFYFYTVTCGFLSVWVAKQKGRRRAWGWMGVLLGLLGVGIVCFLPNKKGVEGQTNPLVSAFKRLSGVSPTAVWLTMTGVVVIVGGVLLTSYLTDYASDQPPIEKLELGEEDWTLVSAETVYGEIDAVFNGDTAQFVRTEKGDLYGWGLIDMEPLEESGLLYQKAKKICQVGETIYLLTADGTLYAKGDNTNGLILGQSAKKVEKFVRIADKVKDADLSVAVGAVLKTDGTLQAFGNNSYYQLGKEKGAQSLRVAENVVQMQLTDRSLYYRTKDGSVYGMGDNAYGQFGLGDQKPRTAPTLLAKSCVDFAAGDDFLLLLKKDGSLLSAGNNAEGQLARQTAEELAELQKELIEQGEAEAAEEEGKEKAVSHAKFGEVAMEKAPSRLGAADHTAYALVEETLYGWGRNQYGQAGKGGVRIYEPQIVCETVAEFSADGDTLLVITAGGKLLGVGDLRYGQLGLADGDGLSEIAEIEEASK